MLVYLLCIALVGLPLMYSELIIGRRGRARRGSGLMSASPYRSPGTVITSYSIHYTKLYDLPGEDAAEANPYVAVPIASGIGEARNAIIACSAALLIVIGVITSYSIHYTKLYE